MFLTIFTPAYNRCDLLCRLYKSLLNQTNKSFEWLIVDDGSSDNTKNVVESWTEAGLINIRYIYQNNGGKYKAFNKGVKEADTELFFCVDSDDFVTDNAVEIILTAWKKHKNDSSLSGILAVKVDQNKKRLSDMLPQGIAKCNTYLLSTKYKCNGEWALIYKTEILKNNLFPEFENTKFMPEILIYDKIAKCYDMLLIDKAVNVCEYQGDGYSSSYIRTMIENPIGFKLYYAQRIDMALNLKERAGYILRYSAFKFLSTDNKYNYAGKHKLLCIMAAPFGFAVAVRYKALLKG